VTVPIQTPIIAYVGNGITTVFAFPFAILQSDDLKVLLDSAPQSVGIQYSINGIGNPNGGSVVFNSPPAVGAKLIQYRDVAIERDTDYQDNGDLLATTVNADFDRLWMALQDKAAAGGRAIQYPITEFATDGTLPEAAARESTILGFDANGVQTLIPIPASVGAGDLRNEAWTAGTDYTAGTSNSVTLSRAYTSKANLGTVVMAGVPQDPATYDLAPGGMSLLFNAIIPAYVNRIWCYGGTTASLNTPATASVTDASIAPGTALYDRVFNVVSVEDPQFGASPAAADNWAAIQAAVTYCLAHGKALRVPGKYSCSKQITGTGSLMVYGYGMDLSEISWPATATSVGLSVTLSLKASSLSSTAGVEDVSFVTAGAAVAGSTALAFKGALNTSADRVTPRVTVNRVAVRGATNQVNDGFDVGLSFDNCTGVVVDQFNCWGKVGAGGQPNYDSTYGIIYTNNSGGTPHPTEFSFQHCRVYGVKNAIYTRDFEGGFVSKCQLVGVNTGITFSTPGPGYPHAIACNNHINASDLCIAVPGMYEVQIHDNLLYKLEGPSIGTGVSLSGGAQFCNVHDNTFECYSQSQAMNAIVVSDASNNLIHSNIFRRTNSIDGTAHGVGVWLTAASSGNKLVDSGQIYALTNTPYLNQGSNTVI